MFQSLHLQHFRSYTDYVATFDGGVTIVVGPNGSGKTNLLEALYVLSTGSSFRVADRALLQYDQAWFKLRSQWGDQERVLTYRVDGDKPEKQFSLDGTKKLRLSHQQRVPVVLFEPDHLRLLSGSPTARRDYIDTLLTKLQPDFSWTKHQFERVLTQRNNILKKRLPPAQLDDYLFAWDIKFAQLAQVLVARRQGLVQQFAAHMSDVYSKLAHKQSQVEIMYKSTVPQENYQAAALQLLAQNRARDVERGFTTIGPHRDDFSVTLNHAPAELAASRGEIRSLLLVLKIIELRMLAEHSDAQPLLLLDDVFSELDITRRSALAELAQNHQTIITTTDADAITQHFLSDYKVIATESQM